MWSIIAPSTNIDQRSRRTNPGQIGPRVVAVALAPFPATAQGHKSHILVLLVMITTPDLHCSIVLLRQTKQLVAEAQLALHLLTTSMKLRS